MNLPFYDQTKPELIGRPYLMGVDEFGNRVYFMGMRTERQAVTHAIRTLLQMAQISADDYILQDSFPLINFSTKLGGALSKRFEITWIGRKISVWGIQRRYPQFVELVQRVKGGLKS